MEVSESVIVDLSSTICFKTWNYDGLIIQAILKKKEKETDGEIGEEEEVERSKSLMKEEEKADAKTESNEENAENEAEAESKTVNDEGLETVTGEKTTIVSEGEVESNDKNQAGSVTEDESGSVDETESGAGDDASTIILDESEWVEDRINSLLEENLEGVAQDYSADTVEDNFDGAVGLWGKDYQLPCFKAAPVYQPTFQNVEYQGTYNDQSDILLGLGISLGDSLPNLTFGNAGKSSSSYSMLQLGNAYEPLDPLPSMTFGTSKANQSNSETSLLLKDLVKAADEAIAYTRVIDNCAICKRSIPSGVGILLKDCLHSFCRECLIHSIKNNVDAEMKCPSRIVVCTGEVRDEEIKALLTLQDYECYNREMLRKMNVNDTAELFYQYEYVENKHDFQCDICLQDIFPGDGLVLKECVHNYCKPCLSKYIETHEAAMVPCPFKDDDGLRCIGNLQDTEVRSLVTIEVYLAFINRSLLAAEAECPNAYHCKTPDCPAWVEIEGEIDQFRCQGCNRLNCFTCKAVHEGTSCQEYQEMVHGPDRRAQENLATENQVRNLLVSKTTQKCPHCGILVQRTEGCREMNCTKCAKSFNWTGI